MKLSPASPILLPLILAICSALPSPISAAEADLVEALALTDATPFKKMDILYESKAKPQTAESNEEKASLVRMFRGQVAGEDRLLFEIRFDQPPIMDRSSFCLYLDLDNDPNTGRQDEGAQGVDLMAVIEPEKAPYLQFRNPDLNDSSSKMRAVWDGPRLLVTVETPLPSNPAAIRTYFLSSKDKGASNSATPSETLMEVNPSEIKLPKIP
ncbi:MAG: hypothetical protein ACOYM3_14575 [Terrimicrobiaceae bacterium]